MKLTGPLCIVAIALLSCHDLKAAEWSASLAVGDAFLPIATTDQDGVARDNTNLSGENGFLFFFIRSVVW